MSVAKPPVDHRLNHNAADRRVVVAFLVIVAAVIAGFVAYLLSQNDTTAPPAVGKVGAPAAADSSSWDYSQAHEHLAQRP